MLRLFTPGRALTVGAVAAAAVGCLLAFVIGERAAAQPARKRYDGAVRCKDCHTQQTTAEQLASLNFVTLTEYAIWKTLDKHAQAYAVLKSERGKEMGKLLGNVDVTDPKVGCMNCHAMHALRGGQVETFTPEDGVSCGGCHGPSENWLTEHTEPSWRKLSPKEKADKGMVDVRDPVVRAELCVSCHVGNAAQGKVVTHAMFAAGHPPLPPFEAALFSKNMPQHWRDPGDIPFFAILDAVAALPAQAGKEERQGQVKQILTRYQKAGVTQGEVNRFLTLYPTPDVAKKVLAQYPYAEAKTLQTKLALAGNVVSLRETLRLAADRADPGPKADLKEVWPDLLEGGKEAAVPSADALRRLAAERWPELAMAHSDCYACHHDLQYPGYRQKRGYGYRLPEGGWVPTTPGRPQIRSWPFALLGPEVRFAVRGQQAIGQSVGQLRGDVTELARTFDAQPFGARPKVAEAARKIVPWCDALLKDLKAARPDPAAVRHLLQQLCGMDGLESLDYESARQVAAVATVAYEELHAKGGAENKKARQALDALADELNLRPYRNRAQRQKLLRDVVEGTDKDAADVGEFFKSAEHLDDMDLLRKMVKNKFLAAVRTSITNEQMNEMLEKGVVKELEAINNKELGTALRKVSRYDPAVFKTNMAALGAQLGGQAGQE
jgi:hypothetical protein